MKRWLGAGAVAVALVLSACGASDEDRRTDEVSVALCKETKRRTGGDASTC